MRALQVGWRAHAALVASGGVATVVAPLSRSVYAEAAGALIWIGSADAPAHPRAVLASTTPMAAAGATVPVTIDGIAPWRPPPLRLDGASIVDGGHAAAISHAARLLQDALADIGEPRGLARLLGRTADSAGDHRGARRFADDRLAAVPRVDDLATARARPYVSALGRACAGNDAPAFADAARPLLGLGAGLTPAGDDVVGGALFGRRVLAGMDATWDAIAEHIVADAAHRTHPISARLLADLAAGEGWAPLHDLACALAAGDAEGTRRAARRLTTLGDASGWNVLAGFLVSLRAPHAPADGSTLVSMPHPGR